MASDILIVDDEADIRELVAGILQDEGYDTRTARDSDDAMASIKGRRPNLVFLDIWLQGSRLDGLQLLDSVKAEHPDLPVVMISGHGNIETAVAAIKQGAYDFIEKPFKADRLVLVADRALETSRLKREVKELKQLTPHAMALVGHSTAINQLRATIDKVSPTNSRTLIVGPSGSGKELAARTIHGHSGRAGGPFVVINAAAITPERMEIELFGSRRLTAARCSSTRSPTCRARRRTRSCACWSTRPSSGSAAAPRCRSTCASSRRPRATSRRRSRRENSARTCFTGCRWCRSACRRSPSGATTSRS
jgi:DNA-binding NtrC family response regulator